MSKPAIENPSQNALNLKAIALMILAMAGFALADTIIRMAASGPPDSPKASIAQLIFTQALAGTLIFGILMVKKGERFTRELIFDKLILLRSLSDVIAATFIITSLSLMSVGSVSAIMQVQPLMITLGAVFILGEAVSWRRWSAVIIGFLGVMIIISPWSETFDWNVVYVLAGVIGLTIRDLVTRLIDVKFSSYALVTFVSLALFPIAAFLRFLEPDGGSLDPTIIFYTISSSIIAMLAYYTLTISMRIGEISVVAPYRYSRLIAAFLVAYLLLGEEPGTNTIVGSAIVIGAGIYVLYRERIKREK